MKEYIFLYLLFKLNDIKEFLDNDYGYSFISIIILLILFGIRTAGEDNDGDIMPFVAFVTDRDRRPEFLVIWRRYLAIFFIILGLQSCMNMVSTALPTTGQAVGIITAGKGMQSDTFQALADLDPSIAEYLQREVKDFLESNLKTEE